MLVNAKQIHATVPGDGLGQDLLICSFDKFVHEPGGEGVLNPVALLCGGGAEPMSRWDLPVPEWMVAGLMFGFAPRVKVP